MHFFGNCLTLLLVTLLSVTFLFLVMLVLVLVVMLVVLVRVFLEFFEFLAELVTHVTHGSLMVATVLVLKSAVQVPVVGEVQLDGNLVVTTVFVVHGVTKVNPVRQIFANSCLVVLVVLVVQCLFVCAPIGKVFSKLELLLEVLGSLVQRIGLGRKCRNEFLRIGEFHLDRNPVERMLLVKECALEKRRGFLELGPGYLLPVNVFS